MIHVFVYISMNYVVAIDQYFSKHKCAVIIKFVYVYVCIYNLYHAYAHDALLQTKKSFNYFIAFSRDVKQTLQIPKYIKMCTVLI